MISSSMVLMPAEYYLQKQTTTDATCNLMHDKCADIERSFCTKISHHNRINFQIIIYHDLDPFQWVFSYVYSLIS